MDEMVLYCTLSLLMEQADVIQAGSAEVADASQACDHAVDVSVGKADEKQDCWDSVRCDVSKRWRDTYST